MITVISGTNRKGSETSHVAKHIFNELSKISGEEVKFLDLQDIPSDWFHNAMYSAENQSESLTAIQDEYILPADKLFFVTPEYNGGFPGVVKLFIDACSIRKYKENFQGKKAALVGVASGRAGNLRGMEHLTGVLNYLGTTVYPQKLPVSSIGSVLDENKKIVNKDTLSALEKLCTGFVSF